MLAATTPYSLQPGGTMHYTVLFTPTSEGSKNTVLRVEAHGDSSTIHEIPLQGFGLPPPQPDILAAPNPLDFGDLLVARTESKNLRIWNVGDLRLTISTLALGGADAEDFTLNAPGGDLSIPPGDSTEVALSFTPSRSGARSAWLQIHSNDPQTGILQIPLTGLGIPLDEPDIDSVDSLVLDSVGVGELSDSALRLSNEGLVALEITSLSLLGADANQFGITGPAVPLTIGPLDSTVVLLQFVPTSPGLKTAVLQIGSSDPDEGTLPVPLYGTGLKPEIAVSPPTQDFGALFVDEQSSSRTFVLHNEGGVDLQVALLELGGPDAEHFELLSGSGPFVVPPGAQELVDVRFAPTSTGPLLATLQIQSDDPDQGLLTVDLGGTGIPKPEAHVFFEESVRGEATGSASVTTTSAPAAVAGHLYVAAIATKRHEMVTAVSGMSLTWSRVLAQCGAREQTGVEVWVGSGDVTPGSVTATIANAANSVALVVARYSGVDLESPIGNTTSANTNGIAGLCGDGTDSNAYALDLFTTSDEALVFAAVAMRNRQHTPGSGFTLRDGATAGSGGNMASVDVMDQNVAPPSLVSIDGSFDGNVDWAVVGFEIRPAATPKVQVQPLSHDFGELTVGNTGTTSFEIRNIGGTPLEVPEIRLQGADAAEFHIAAGGVVPTLPAGASHLVSIEWEPLSPGAKSADLRVISNDRSATTLDILLQGTAIAAIPGIAVAPQAIDFGSVDTVSSAKQSLLVYSTGMGSLLISGLSLVGTDSLEFSLEAPNLPFSLAPGDSTQIAVTFTPTTVGDKSTALRIESDDPDAPVLFLSLSGSGVAPVATQVEFEESVQGGASASPTVVTSGSLAAVAGGLYLGATASKGYLPVVDVSGMGLTWTPVRAQCGGRQQTGVEIWMGSGTPVEGAVSATFSNTPSNAVIVVARYSGADLAAPLGTIVSANTNGLEGDCSGGNDSGSFALSLTTSDDDAVVFAAAAMRYRQLTPGAGYVLRDEARIGADGAAASVAVMDQEFPIQGMVSLDGTFDANVDWAVVGVEIRPHTTAAQPTDVTAVPRQVQVRLVNGVAGKAPWVELATPRDVVARVRLFDVRGRLVDTLWDAPLAAGRTRLSWSGRHPSGRVAPSGVYFVLTEVGARVFKGKLVLLR
jgi:hypothetical protein